MSHVNKYSTKSSLRAASLGLCLTRLHHPPALQGAHAPSKAKIHISSPFCVIAFYWWFPHLQFFSRVNFYPAKAAWKTLTQDLCGLSVLDLPGNNEEGTTEATAMKTSPQTIQNQIRPEENVDREIYNLQTQSSVKKRFPIFTDTLITSNQTFQNYLNLF